MMTCSLRQCLSYIFFFFSYFPMLNLSDLYTGKMNDEHHPLEEEKQKDWSTELPLTMETGSPTFLTLSYVICSS